MTPYCEGSLPAVAGEGRRLGRRQIRITVGSDFNENGVLSGQLLATKGSDEKPSMWGVVRC